MYSESHFTDSGPGDRAPEPLHVLTHPLRFRIIQMLLSGDMTVDGVAASCQWPAALVAEQLELMQQCGFLTRMTEGQFEFYRVAERHVRNLLDCLEERLDMRSQ